MTRSRLFSSLIAVVVFTVTGWFLASASFTKVARSAIQERKLKVKGFNNIPVAIHDIRNVQSENWFRDLEIEVKNVSKKPVYFIALHLQFPDIPANGGKTGFTMTYGSPRLGTIRNLAGTGDPSLKPGETYVFKVPEPRVRGFENMKKRMNIPEAATKNILVQFDTIGFGDGTGFVLGSRYVDYRDKTSKTTFRKPNGTLHTSKVFKTPPNTVGFFAFASFIA